MDCSPSWQERCDIMTVFWLTLTIVFISGYFARGLSTEIVLADGVVQGRPSKFFAFIAASILALVSGLRIPMGLGVIGDTGQYSRSFLYVIPNNIADAMEDFKWFNGDTGFNVFQSFIKEYISTDPQVFILVCALITNLCVVYAIYKYSTIFELSLFLYITTGMYLVTMNGIRQMVVSALLFCCLRLIAEGKWLKLLMIVLLISTLHTSALIFIPVYFFVRFKPWSKVVVATLAGSVIVLALFNQVGAILLGGLEGTQYSQYQEYIMASGGGANIIRVFVAAVPVLMAYWGRKKIAERNDTFINILVNFSVLNLAFYVLTLQNWVFVRMTMYFTMAGLILLPWLIKNLFDRETGELMKISCIILYGIYYYYEMSVSLGITYISKYLTFFD